MQHEAAAATHFNTLQHTATCRLPGDYRITFKPGEPLFEVAVSLKSMITPVTWLSSRTDFSVGTICKTGLERNVGWNKM